MNIIVSPSGNFYGSEQVLYDFLESTDFSYHVFVPYNSFFYNTLIKENKKRHKISSFKNIYTLYIKITILLIVSARSVYLNEAGHIRWILILAKLFKKRKFILHLRIAEDIERLPNLLPLNVRLITISKFMQSKINSNIKSDLIFDPYSFTKKGKSLRKENELTIGIIGRISKNKGIIYILDMLSYLSENSIPNQTSFTFIFFGTVSKDDETQSAIEFLKKLKNPIIKFNGFTEKDSIYEQIDVVLHLAPFEPLGRIFFEAMDYAIPLIGFNTGGIGELASLTNLNTTMLSISDGEWKIKAVHLLYNISSDYNSYQQDVLNCKANSIPIFSQIIYNNKINKILN